MPHDGDTLDLRGERGSRAKAVTDIYIFLKKRLLTEKAEQEKTEKDRENHGKVLRKKGAVWEI